MKNPVLSFAAVAIVASVVSLSGGSQAAEVLAGNAKAAPDQALQKAGEQRAEAYAHFLAGRQLEDEGRMREALTHYLAFVRLDSAHAEIVGHVAELTLSYQGMDEALKLLEDAVKTHAGSVDPYLNFTRFAVTHAQDRPDLMARAEKAADEALTRFPKAPHAYENAARLYLTKGDRAKASLTLERALKQDVSDAAFWLNVGRMAQEVWPLADTENRPAHLSKVTPFFDKALRQAQAAADEEAQLQAADYFLFSNQMPRAAEICEGLVKKSGSLDARKRLVRLYDAMDKKPQADAALEDLVKAFPMDVEHRRLLASQYLRKREIEKAADQLEAALQSGGGDLNDYLQISGLLRYVNQPERFDRFTARAQQIFPAEPRILFYRAVALSAREKFTDAAKLFDSTAKAAETSDPELLDDGYFFAWGVALERNGNFDEASKRFEKSIQQTPSDDLSRAANTMNYLGYMWLERGQKLDQAEKLIRKANELEQNNAAFIDSLGWLHFKQGKYQEALADLLRAEGLLKELEPGDAEILDHIAQTYRQLGDNAKAQEYWKRILDLNPPDSPIRQRAEKEVSPPKPPKPDPAADDAPKSPSPSFPTAPAPPPVPLADPKKVP